MLSLSGVEMNKLRAPLLLFFSSSRNNNTFRDIGAFNLWTWYRDWTHRTNVITISTVLMLIGDNHTIVSLLFCIGEKRLIRNHQIYKNKNRRRKNVWCMPTKLNKQANNNKQLDNIIIIYDGRLSFWVARIKVTIIWLPSNRYLSIRYIAVICTTYIYIYLKCA